MIAPQFLDRFQSDLERNAGEGFADVEGLPVAIEVAVIVRGEGRVPAHFSGQDAARQRYAHDNADIAPHRLGEEQVGGTVPEHVEDDLMVETFSKASALRASSTFSTDTP